MLLQKIWPWSCRPTAFSSGLQALTCCYYAKYCLAVGLALWYSCCLCSWPASLWGMHFKCFVAASPVCYLLSPYFWHKRPAWTLLYLNQSWYPTLFHHQMHYWAENIWLICWSWRNIAAYNLHEYLHPSHCVQAKSCCCVAGSVHKLYRVVKIARAGKGSFSNNIDCALRNLLLITCRNAYIQFIVSSKVLMLCSRISAQALQSCQNSQDRQRQLQQQHRFMCCGVQRRVCSVRIQGSAVKPSDAKYTSPQKFACTDSLHCWQRHWHVKPEIPISQICKIKQQWNKPKHFSVTTVLQGYMLRWGSRSSLMGRQIHSPSGTEIHY